MSSRPRRRRVSGTARGTTVRRPATSRRANAKPRGDSKQAEETVVERSRGVFMISVAAELAEMHPQTLRLYEARGLIAPKRSAKNTRLYSHEDVDRLRRIQEMTAQRGLNLAGVETVLELEERLEEMANEVRRMRGRADELERQMTDEVAQARRTLRAETEIVPYGAYDTDEIVPPTDDERRLKIPIEKPHRRTSDE